ncbi:MAG: metallophosphoesterase, partial [Clostridia bacterium]
MSVFVLSDLHLSHSSDKPMDIFGPQWENHTKKIFDNWQNTVDENDTVIIPGDISWGMNFGNTYEDLMFIEKLNGTKIIGKGNHDYWWQTQKKLNDFLHEKEIKSIKFLYNNAFRSENFIVCGTRSWFV